MRRNGAWSLLLALLAPALAGANVLVFLREAAQARVETLHGLARDAQVLSAVEAQNARRESINTIQTLDRLWGESRDYPLRWSLHQNPCAKRLRELTKGDDAVVEVIVMDNQGANVCVSRETPDYWQGDEAKWQKTFAGGLDPFIDAPAFDQMSGFYAIQISAPVSRDADRIGAVTLTLRVRRPKATSEP